jgi:predicted ABC-type ATPase
MRRLEEALAKGLNHAFETTLGGTSVTAKILEAAKTHDVLIWFCGLSSPELHIARVKARVAAGGHPIPEEKIRERYPSAQLNLIKLMPHVAYIKVYDNNAWAAADGTVPDPVLVLEMESGQVISPAPNDLKALQRAPEWSKSILEAALRAGPACD